MSDSKPSQDDIQLDFEPPQFEPEASKGSRWPWLLALALIILALVLIWVFWTDEGVPIPPGQPAGEVGSTQPGTSSSAGAPGAPGAGAAPAPAAQAGPNAAPGQVPPPPPALAQGKVVEVGPSASSPAALEARKKPYGLDESLDAVVRSDEVIKVGNQEVKVSDLERKLVVEQRGEILDKPLGKPAKVTAWGVHLVRSGDNLWDLHYQLLREYMGSRGIELPTNADEPLPEGGSSGVGRILKFAEHMVGVFNLNTGKMSSNLDLLEPGHKVVVFNLGEIFAQLAKIDPENLSGVSFDGRVLLFPERKAKAGGTAGS